MRLSLYNFGYSFDYKDEINTCSPLYYHWTQWLFIQLFKNNLAYQKEGIVNWDPVDKTVLADEQVDENGRSWRSGSIVEKKRLKQWYFKITNYADRLIKDLDELDGWSDSIKNIQKGWIGMSKGVEIKFPCSNNNDFIKIYTTRADTIYGATFIAISPFHPLVNKYITTENDKKIINDIKNSLNSITGMKLKGFKLPITAIHPLTNKNIPIYVTNYVIDTYTTQALMGIPAHDLRDFEFARLYDINIQPVIKSEKIPIINEGVLINSGEFSNMTSKEGKIKIIETLKNKGFCEEKTKYIYIYIIIVIIYMIGLFLVKDIGVYQFQ